MEKLIKEILEKEIRPALQRDGGDLEFVKVEKDGKVKIRLTGSCHGCPFAQMTIKNGIERILKKRVPDVTEVEAVNM
jgi:Fe-S cluster biogenesis protein NfuA